MSGSGWWLVAGAGAGAGSCVEKYHKAGDHGRSLQTREREQQLQEAVNWELEI